MWSSPWAAAGGSGGDASGNNRRSSVSITGGVVHQNQSPPTKWPRLMSTPTRSDSLLCTSIDSGLGSSFGSPPMNKSQQQRLPSPVLRTPTSRNIMHINTSPSPFRSFRLSSFTASPGNRALRLSNTENVFGVRFCEEQVVSNALENGPLTSTPVARCLQMPSTSSDAKKTKIEVKQVNNVEISQQHHIPETPSKCLQMVDCGGGEGLFSEFSLLGTSPLKDLSDPMLMGMSEDDNFFRLEDPCLPGPSTSSSQEPKTPEEMTRPPSTPSSFKKAMLDVQRRQEMKRSYLVKGEPPDVLDATMPYYFSENVDTEPRSFQYQKSNSKDHDGKVFRTPRKALKPYSRRWMRIVTGSTPAQQEIQTAAHAFMEQRRRANNTSLSAPTRIPTSALVPMWNHIPPSGPYTILPSTDMNNTRPADRSTMKSSSPEATMESSTAPRMQSYNGGVYRKKK